MPYQFNPITGNLDLVNAAVTGNFVTFNGTETITGTKTFTIDQRIAQGVKFQGEAIPGVYTPLAPAMFDNNEYGWSMEQLKVTGGRFNAVQLGGKVEFKITGGSSSFAVYNDANGGNIWRVNGDRTVDTFNTLKMNSNKIVDVLDPDSPQEAATKNYVDARTTKLRSITASASITAADYVVLVNTSGGAVTVTLPSAVGITGKSFAIKKTTTDTNTFSIATVSSQTIEGSPSPFSTTSTTRPSYNVISDGSNWWFI